MKELPKRFDFNITDEKWTSLWDKEHTYHAKADSGKPPYTIVIPPPNITGILHMGHALNNTLQDIIIRYKRMKGFETLWMAGTDHAGIATQNVVEKQLAKEGLKRQDIGREEFLKRLWVWKEEYGDTIIHQLKKLGASCDWERARFTMDEKYSEAVKDVFIKLHRKGLIYRGERIINWCPRCQTALSDEEAEHEPKQGNLWHIRYPFKNDPEKFVIVATTRPETMLGDTAVAVNPDDPRYKKLVGESLILPIIGREIKIISDEFVDPAFGSGAVKVTPAHDPNDFAMGQRHNLEIVNIMHPDGVLNENAGEFKGLDRFAARKAVVAKLTEMELLEKIDVHELSVGHCYRCHTVVEPYLSKQWFVKMKPLAEKAAKAVENGDVVIYPERWSKVYMNWMDGIRDWCISRQIWWGHRIPVWYDKEGNTFVAYDEAEAKTLAKKHHGKDVELKQDEDVLDTWFSSWLWPFATLGWPKETPELKYFYPTNSLFTASEIIFFWVARMVMAGIEFMGKAPFSQVYIHGTVRDAKGRKMSKSLGNALDPLEIISEYGTDALRFSLIINSGQDLFISKEKFEIGRNFANKIWNASRLILQNIENVKPVGSLENAEKLDLPSRWIISKFQTALTEAGESIEKFRYSEAESVIYDFFWNNFCDWYLEIIKNKWSDAKVQNVVMYTLTNSLKLIHPFMPVVTEELWHFIDDKEQSIGLSAWPKINSKLTDKKAESDMQQIIDLTIAIRNIRAEWNIKLNQKVTCEFSTQDESCRKLLNNNQALVETLVGTDNLLINTQVTLKDNVACAVVGNIQAAIPLGNVIDIEQEKKRIRTQIQQHQKNADGLSQRLNNEKFVSGAPKDVIDKSKEQLAALENTIRQLTEVVKNLN